MATLIVVLIRWVERVRHRHMETFFLEGSQLRVLPVHISHGFYSS